MILSFLSLILVLLIGVFFFIFWPIFEKNKYRVRATRHRGFLEWQNLMQEKEVLLDNLKEVQLDYQMQKLEETDFQSLKAKLMNELSQIVSKIEEIERSDSFLKQVYMDIEKEGI